MPAVYFAWTSASEQWGPAVLREDEQITAIEITHSEGDFASLKIAIRNPRVGLLSNGRQKWCWLSWTPTEEAPMPIPIFRGRLIGSPESLQDEIITLEFVARPDDFQGQKIAVAAALKVAPYWDPVWLDDRVDDPDTALEARPALWHCDRVTLTLTTSDIIDGEDGTLDVTEDEHFYEDLDLTYAETPLRRVSVTGTVSWDQEAEGEVDLTAAMVTAFRDAGSPLESPLICSLTGDGLYDNWPKIDTSIGGGWTVGPSTTIRKATWVNPADYSKTFLEYDPVALLAFDTTTGKWNRPTSIAAGRPHTTWAVVFPVHSLSIKFGAAYTASRKRSEVVTFTLEADIQSLFTDPGSDEEATAEYTSDAILDPIDPGDVAPLDDARRNSYFKTDRGKDSFAYLISLARAKILARARAVKVKFIMSWANAIYLTCRHNVRLHDPRLPGGNVIGKVINLVYSYSEDKVEAEVTIGCTIGHGGIAAATVGGTPTYVEDGYFEPGQVQISLGATIAAGDITYLDFQNNFLTLDDDGVDFFNMTPGNVLKAVSQAAVSLTTTADTHTATTLDNLASTTGLVVDGVYEITGDNIQNHTQFTYTGSGAGTLSLAGTAEGSDVVVTISAASINSNGILITNGPADQTEIIDEAVGRTPPDPVEALKAAPTRICLDLVPVEGGPFQTDFAQVLSTLPIPKTIDLEAL